MATTWGQYLARGGVKATAAATGAEDHGHSHTHEHGEHSSVVALGCITLGASSYVVDREGQCEGGGVGEGGGRARAEARVGGATPKGVLGEG